MLLTLCAGQLKKAGDLCWFMAPFVASSLDQHTCTLFYGYSCPWLPCYTLALYSGEAVKSSGLLLSIAQGIQEMARGELDVYKHIRQQFLQSHSSFFFLTTWSVDAIF